MPKPAETIALQIAGEPTQIAKHIVDAVPGAQRFLNYLQQERGCKPSTTLQYFKVVGLYFHKKKKQPRGAAEVTGVQHYDKWRVFDQDRRLSPIQTGTGIPIAKLLEAKINDLRPITPSVWKLFDVALTPEILNLIAQAFYEVWGTSRTFKDMAPTDFIFGEPYASILPPKPVEDKPQDTLAALTLPQGLAHDYAVNAEAFITEDIHEFAAHVEQTSPNGVLLSRNAVSSENQGKVLECVAGLLQKWVSA